MPDLYQSLLDVRDLRRPPTLYQLLGLADFEEDEDRIARAIRSRRSLLMDRKKQASVVQWQRVSQELDQAINTLTNLSKKSEYDLQLAEDPKMAVNESAQKVAANGAVTTKSAAAVAATSTCPSCAAANATGRKFCGACGHPLIEPCIECDAETFVDERFCGTCGVNLAEAASRRTEKANLEVARAKQLNDEGRYQEALAVVQPLAELNNSRLRQVSQRSRELMEEIVERRDQSKSRSDDALAQGVRAVKEHRWHDAVTLLSAIPQLLRSKDHQDLLAQAEEAVGELDGLNVEVRAAIKADETLHLLPKVERVIELDPHNERMKMLASRLRARRQHDACRERDRLIRETNALLKDYRYQEAGELLDQVPHDALNEEVEQLQAQVAELAFLWDCLRHSPTASPVLVDLGSRLAKMSPKDQKLAAILAQLRERLDKKAKNPLERVPWAKAPAETTLGPAIKYLSSMGQIDVSKVAANGLFVDNCPRFYAAAGAALQGLGLARVQTNLLPKTEGGMFGQLRSLVQRSSRSDSAWGIDLSSSGLKAIKLVRRPKNDAVFVDGFDVVDHSTLLGGVSRETERSDIMAQTLTTFAKRNSIKDAAVCVVVPGTLVLGKFFEIPPIEDKKIDELMHFEARQQVPIPMDQLEWDYHVWGRFNANALLPRRVMLVAGKRHQMLQEVSRYQDANLRVRVVQTDCVALYNFLQYAIHKQMPNADSEDRADGAIRPLSMILDVGAQATNCVVCGDDTVWFRSFPRGSDEFNNALMRRFEVSFATAEQLKLNPAKARRISNLHESWEPVFDQLRNDARDSLNAFSTQNSDRHVNLIWGCGGGFRTLGLHRYLLD